MQMGKVAKVLRDLDKASTITIGGGKGVNDTLIVAIVETLFWFVVFPLSVISGVRRSQPKRRPPKLW